MKYENSDGVSHSSLDSGTPFQNSTPFENPFTMKIQIPAGLSRFNTTPSRKSHTKVNGLRRSLRAVVLASLCGLAAIPAPAVTSVASNLKVSVSGDKMVLSWTGTPGVLYQAQGATSLGGNTAWQVIDVPTTSSSVTSIRTSPAQFYRVGIFTNMDPYSTYARSSSTLAPDTAPPTVPTGLTGSAPTSGQVNLSWNASIDQGTITKVSGKNVTNTSGLKGYNVYRGGVFLTQVPAPATTTSDTSVNPSTTYSYTVKAIDIAGNSSASSSAVNVTTPAAAIANYSISPANASYAANGGSGSANVTGGSGSWSVSNPNAWITITSGTSGTGNGTVNYTVSANTATSQRSGNITIAGQTFTVTEAAAAGTYSLSPANASYSASAGSGSVSVTGGAGNWSVSNPNAWITITSGATGTGNGTVYYSVAANTGTSQRSGTMTIAGQTFTLTQAGAAGCAYSISPATSSIGSPAASGSVSVNITAGSGCNWSVSNPNTWITITSGASGTGNGTVNYSVAANTSTSQRSGNMTIAGQTFTLTQAGSSPNQPPVANAGSDLTVTLGSTAALNGSGSRDPDGTISSYQWSFGDGYTASGVSVSHTYSGLGVYTVTLTVTDNLGATGSDTALVTVAALPDTTPPTVSLTSPVSGSTVSSMITLNANASDNVGVARVEYYCDAGVPLGTNTSSSPYNVSCNTTTMPNGSHSFYAKAYDAAGNSTTSAANTVTVNNQVVQSGPWATAFGGSGADYGQASAVDSGGNILFAGTFQGSVSFGGAVFNSLNGSIVLAKYSPSGVHLWSKQLGGQYGVVKCMTLDASGNIFLGGSFYVTGNFGGTDITSNGDADSFLAKYNPQGNHLWSIGFGTLTADAINSVAVDSQGNVIVTGYFKTGTILPLRITGTDGVTSSDIWGSNLQDTFLAKFSATGGFIFAKHWFNTGNDQGITVAVDKSPNPANNNLPYDNILLVGNSDGQIDFGGNYDPNNGYLPAGGYLAKLTPSGDYIKARSCGAGVGGLAVDSNGDVVVGGIFKGQADLGHGVVSGTSYDSDSFVVKYSGTDLSWKWQALILGNGSAPASSLAIDGQNNVIITGSFYGSEHFGAQTLTNQSPQDGFVAKYSSAGVLSWAQQVVSTLNTGYAGGQSVAVGASGQPVVTGSFKGTTTIGNQSLTSAGGTDIFLMQRNP